MTSGDTIVAISSAISPAARIIVRASGWSAHPLAQLLGANVNAGPATASRCTLRFSGIALPAWVYLFHSPHSYTGENLVEFHVPGNPIVARMLLDELLRSGARGADPGEFTARAYFNGKMDLTAAEGVAATIAATSQRELSAARQLLSGELARRLAPAMELLTDTLALIEVAIDFSEEDVSFLTPADLRDRIERADRMLESLLRDSARFERLSHEPQVVLVGRPNAGKSTLLNALAGQERALVSSIAGTTRDVLSAQIRLSRGAICLRDVAGLDDEIGSGANEIERKMRSHAMRETEAADVLVLVEDSTDPRPRLHLARASELVVRTKLDLYVPARGAVGKVAWAPRPCLPMRSMGGAPKPRESTPATTSTPGPAEVSVSAITGIGLDLLRERLDAVCFGDISNAVSLALNLRHVRGIEDARLAMGRARDQLPAVQPELLSLEIREAIDALGEVLGRVTADDVLGRVFAGFCIGK